MFDVIAGIGGAIDGAIRHAVAGLPGGSVSFRVQPDRVYELANRFELVADKIDGVLGHEILTLMVDPPGADKPSVDAAARLVETGFGGAGLVTRLDAYTNELRMAAASLRQTAQQYGLTDHTEGGRLSAANL